MISPLAYIDPSAKIGQNVNIHPFAYIDADVEIGDGCEIKPYASVISGTTLGCNTRVFQGAIVGADPQDFRWKGAKTYCRIGNDVTIREQVIINRSIHQGQATVVGDGTFILAGSHIGHDCVIEGRSVLGNGVTLAGDVKVGVNTILSSNCILHEGTVVGDWVLVKGGCRIAGNVPPFVIMAHNPVAYYGVNAYVMRRHGFSDEDIDSVAKAYRHVYQSGTSVFNALKRIEADVEESELRNKIVSFIRDSKLRIVAAPIDTD